SAPTASRYSCRPCPSAPSQRRSPSLRIVKERARRFSIQRTWSATACAPRSPSSASIGSGSCEVSTKAPLPVNFAGNRSRTHSSSADVRAPSWAEVGSSRSSVQPGSARARESASASSRRCRSPRESVATDVNGSKRRRRPWGEAVRARDAAGEHCGADAENAAVQLDPAGSARQRLREQQEEGGGNHGHVRGAPGLRERARRAALVGATEEERRAEGRVGRKAGRTEAVDQRVGDDVDEDGAGHSGEQERAELPAPPQPEPVAEQDRPAFLA